MVRACFFILVLLSASPGFAQAPEADLQLYRETPDPNAILATPTAEVAGHLNAHAGLSTNWSHRPLRLTIADEGVPLGDVVAERVDLHLTAGLGLWSFLHVGVDLPAVAFQQGVNTEIVERVLDIDEVPSAALGDLSLYLKGQVFEGGGLLPAIALGAEVLAPTGNAPGLTGEPSAVLLPFVTLSQRLGDDAWALQLGYRVRFEPMRIAGVEIDDQIVYRFGFAYRLGRLPSETPATLLAEIAGQTPAAHPFGVGGDNPRALTSLEARIGLRYPWRTGIGGIRLTPAVGAGLLPAVGSPQLRFSIGVDWLNREPRGDDDGDRIPNVSDACPREPEDLDDFQDLDGCPEWDNDRDGIPDEDDECPDQREDKDGFQDMDGCLDWAGPDADDDGIPDHEDGCPNEAEDVDGFVDWDGCLDEDNDRDGLPDVGDVCPDAAEDENGFQDDDGCPDEGEHLKLVNLTREGVELHQPVRFEEGKAAVHDRSRNLLDAIAKLLEEKPKIRLRIIVRPEHPNREGRLLALDRAGTIKTELVARGVDEQRLRAWPIVRWRPRAKQVELVIDRRRR